MKYISSWTVPQGSFNVRAVARFLETGGAPPEGVTKQALKSDPHITTATHVRQRWHAHRMLIHVFIDKRANRRLIQIGVTRMR